MSTLTSFLLNRLAEPSTWRGLSLLIGLAGYSITPENVEHIIATVALFNGIFGVLPDK